MVEKIKKGVRILGLTLGWCLVIPVCIYFLPVILFQWMMFPAEFEPEWRAYKREKRLKRQQWRAELLEKRRFPVSLRPMSKKIVNNFYGAKNAVISP